MIIAIALGIVLAVIILRIIIPVGLVGGIVIAKKATENKKLVGNFFNAIAILAVAFSVLFSIALLAFWQPISLLYIGIIVVWLLTRKKATSAAPAAVPIPAAWRAPLTIFVTRGFDDIQRDRFVLPNFGTWILSIAL